MFFGSLNQNALRFRAVWFLAALLFIVAGSVSAAGPLKPDRIITPADLGAAQARALQFHRPLVLLITEPGSSRADDEARNAFESRSVRQVADGKAFLAIVDFSVSRARATTARFHPLETPLLVCLSPRGMVLSRSQKPVTRELISEEVRRAVETAPETDRKLEPLEKAADNHKTDPMAQLALTDFLLEQNNAFEAIPVLTVVAHAKDVPTSLRIRAWADVVRSHFWIGESEKGRHEALDLIAELGTNPEARAAANLALGNQDAANPKRIERARQEFKDAIVADPESVYGKQAAAALAKLPKGSL